MVKHVLYHVVIQVLIIICYLAFGLGIPILFNIEIPIVFLFSWIIAPITTVFVASYLIKYLKAGKSRLYIALSFAINLISILIYTWFEGKRPHIDGDFLDFRGLLFSVFGIGQIVGIIFSFFPRVNRIGNNI